MDLKKTIFQQKSKKFKQNKFSLVAHLKDCFLHFDWFKATFNKESKSYFGYQ